MIFRWRCLGCGETQLRGYGDRRFMTQDTAHDRANKHASGCRSMPLVPAPSLVDELTALRAEVTRVGEGLAAVAEAVRGLPGTTAGSLAGIATAIENIPDHRGPLGDIARRVESLTSAVEERGRRPWWGRRRSAQIEEVSA